MSYIGKEPQTGAYSMLDALTASATASYSLTLDSTAFVPESANHLLVSLNGVIQKAGSSYTVSGSTLTFSSSLASSDSIDFVLALGNVLDIGTPSDATVTNAKTNFVSTSSAAGLQIKGDGTTDGTLQLNCSQNSHGIKLKSPAHSTSSSYTLTFPGTDPSADKFLKTDGSGNLSFADAGSSFAGALVYRTSTLSNISQNADVVIGFDAEVYDTDSFHDNSTNNSRFTIPSTHNGKKAILRAHATFQDVSDGESYELRVFKNNAANQDGAMILQANRSGSSSGNKTLSGATHPIDIATNDYFEAVVSTNETDVDISNGGNGNNEIYFGAFSIQIVE